MLSSMRNIANCSGMEGNGCFGANDSGRIWFNPQRTCYMKRHFLILVFLLCSFMAACGMPLETEWHQRARTTPIITTQQVPLVKMHLDDFITIYNSKTPEFNRYEGERGGYTLSKIKKSDFTKLTSYDSYYYSIDITAYGEVWLLTDLEGGVMRIEYSPAVSSENIIMSTANRMKVIFGAFLISCITAEELASVQSPYQTLYKLVLCQDDAHEISYSNAIRVGLDGNWLLFGKLPYIFDATVALTAYKEHEEVEFPLEFIMMLDPELSAEIEDTPGA